MVTGKSKKRMNDLPPPDITILQSNLEFVEKILLEFEAVYCNTKIQEELPNIKSVYAELIIVYLSKMVSSLRSDHHSLGKFKGISSEPLDDMINGIKSCHERLIKNISDNRSKRVAHTDQEKHSYSPREKSKRISGIKDSFKNSGKDVPSDEVVSGYVCPQDAHFERITPDDLYDDLGQIKQLLCSIGIFRDQFVNYSYTHNKPESTTKTTK